MNSPGEPAKTQAHSRTLVRSFIKISRLLKLYYPELPKLAVHKFLLEPAPGLGAQGRVWVHEEPQAPSPSVYLGIELGSDIFSAFRVYAPSLSLNALGVLAEETSHFLMLTDAAANHSQLSLMELEVLGEIDRFLVFMHWNSLMNASFPLLNAEFKNLHDICDAVFCGPRFSAQTHERYVEAEKQAFCHLKKAFKKVWDHTAVDFSKVEPEASRYLCDLRGNMLGKMRQVS